MKLSNIQDENPDFLVSVEVSNLLGIIYFQLQVFIDQICYPF